MLGAVRSLGLELRAATGRGSSRPSDALLDRAAEITLEHERGHLARVSFLDRIASKQDLFRRPSSA
jgi:hypothetical protein